MFPVTVSLKKQIYKAYGRYSYGGAFCIYSWLVFPHDIVSRMIPKEGTIYDLGCGFGSFSIYLAIKCKQRSVIAIDHSSKRVDSAKRALKNLNIRNLTFKYSDVLSFNYDNCDAVIINNLLHHLSGWPNQKMFLEKIVPTIKPGGQVIIIDIAKRPQWKYYFTLTIDKIMYPGDYIEFPKKSVLEEFFIDNDCTFEVSAEPLHHRMPYSYIMYTARKKALFDDTY